MRYPRRPRLPVLVDGRRDGQCAASEAAERTPVEDGTERQQRELSDLVRRNAAFLAILSHELRNSLAPILNAARFLGRQPNQSEVQRQAGGIIEHQVLQLSYLVGDLLDVSRLATGKISLRLERVALDAVLAHAADAVRPEMERRGHLLRVDLPGTPVWVTADAARIEEILVNLLLNAAKYTENGGRISATLDQAGSDARISVRDNGAGIPPELLSAVFDLFAQAERTYDRAEGGLGIGLALVKQIAELHGGSVAVRSVQGEGSEFVVRIPLASRSPEADVPTRHDRAPSTSAPGLRILVVDDSNELATTFRMWLEDFGHVVRTALDGPAALDVAVAFRPEVVMMDIGLPGSSGLEVAQRMRAEPALRDVVLIAMTGYGSDRVREASRRAGFDHHFVKPPDFARLEELLGEIAGELATMPVTG